jgi:hypothetical protein
MQDFDFKKCTRVCHATEREIGPGESYFSALIELADEVVRQDFSKDNWQAPPEGCIGWWQSRVPVLEKGKIYWAPNSVLLAYFQALVSKPSEKSTAYVMGLLLIQKRILQWKDTVQQEEVEFMVLRNSGTKEILEVEVVDVGIEQTQAIQNELAEQLFTDVIQGEAEMELDPDEAQS